MNIKLAKSEIIHFVGIGGIGMSGLSLIMKGKGFKVQGSDISNNKNIEKLLKIDGILLNSQKGMEESKYREKMFKRVSEMNQTTNLKKYLYFIRQIIRLFMREKQRLDKDENDSLSDTTSVEKINLSTTILNFLEIRCL